jgi:exosortase
MTPVTEPQQARPHNIPWTTLGWFGGLLLACYAPVLWALGKQWYNDADMGHGFFVPALAAYIAWQKRGELLATTPTRNWWGLVIVAYAAIQMYIATLGVELFLSRTAFVISLIGIVLFLGGWRYLRILAFPLLVLFLMVPIPAIVYNRITFPLQILASRVATGALDVLGVPVLREGNILELAEQKLSVVEACSGIRSLLTLTFLALVYGYFFEKRVWMRVVLFVATVPIAIVANAGRVTITGLLTEYKPELAAGFLHSAEGWVIFMVAVMTLIFLHQGLNLATKVAHARREQK